jgi:transcription antitermination factor NusG
VGLRWELCVPRQAEGILPVIVEAARIECLELEGFQQTSYTGPESRRWHILHTKSRQEKALAESLASMGISYFLPLSKLQRTYGHRKEMVELPLFPGYVFLHATLEEAYFADRTKRVAKVIQVVDQATLIKELRQIQLALEAQVPLDPFPYLREGIRVEVRSGPLRGLRGIIEDRLKRDRLILQVETLGRAASLEIDGALLDVVE